MMQIEKILKTAKEQDASDIHLISGLKPMLRIRRSLVPIEEIDVLTDSDMYEIYDLYEWSKKRNNIYY